MTQISRISQKKSILQGDLYLRNLANLSYLRMSFGPRLARAGTHQGQTITPVFLRHVVKLSPAVVRWNRIAACSHDQIRDQRLAGGDG